MRRALGGDGADGGEETGNGEARRAAAACTMPSEAGPLKPRDMVVAAEAQERRPAVAEVGVVARLDGPPPPAGPALRVAVVAALAPRRGVLGAPPPPAPDMPLGCDRLVPAREAEADTEAAAAPPEGPLPVGVAVTPDVCIHVRAASACAADVGCCDPAPGRVCANASAPYGNARGAPAPGVADGVAAALRA